MADQITFNDTLALSGTLDTTTLVGSLDVAYGASASATGTLTVGAFPGFAAQVFDSFSIAQTGFAADGVTPLYLLSATNGVTNLAINYAGMAPSQIGAALANATSNAPLASAAGVPVLSAIVCFAEGTMIRTDRGDVAVERLKAGDRVVTASGEHSAIRWIGSRKIDCRRHPEPRAVLPVRIAAHALAPHVPSRDLYVSPGHGILVDVLDEVLMPAALLCNGSSVQQVEVPAVTYWHVELDRHDILFSNGLRSESYIDVGNRGFFSPLGEAMPDGEREAATLDDYCRPYVTDESFVQAVRQRLQARARVLGWTLDASPFAGLHLVADGKILLPRVDGLHARFTVPAGAREVWLRADPSVPAFVLPGSTDTRRLGVCIRAISAGGRRIEAGDPILSAGFHPAEGEGQTLCRWSTGSAPLPRQLWTGAGDTSLTIEIAGPALPRWASRAPKPAMPLAA